MLFIKKRETLGTSTFTNEQLKLFCMIESDIKGRQWSTARALDPERSGYAQSSMFTTWMSDCFVLGLVR